MATALQTALAGYLDQRGGEGVFHSEIPALGFMRTTAPTLPRHQLYQPALCIVVQGAKRMAVGAAAFDYAGQQALVVGFDLPVLASITQASAEQPFMGMVLEFDIGLLREVLEQLDPPPGPRDSSSLGLFVETLTPPVVACITRLVELLATPQAIPVLYPALARELYYWLLTGPNGGEIAKLALPDSHTRRIARAIHLLRRDFTRALRVADLAEAARMSPSAFHQHFKTMTSMTPLQYQKQLRLLEARRLMLSDAVSAANAAYQVGYQSASQFSREYARLFGVPPRRSVVG